MRLVTGDAEILSLADWKGLAPQRAVTSNGSAPTAPRNLHEHGSKAMQFERHSRLTRSLDRIRGHLTEGKIKYVKPLAF